MFAFDTMFKSDQFLPVEVNGLLEDIIIKAARQLFRVFKLVSSVPDVISLTVLSAVCRSWWTMIESRHNRQVHTRKKRSLFPVKVFSVDLATLGHAL